MGEEEKKDGLETGAEGTGTGTENNNSDEQNKVDTQQKQEKTFTQEEVNRMMAREKKQGRNALLKELGFKDEKSAMSASKSYSAWLEAQKSDEQKKVEKETESQQALADAQFKVEEAEAKVEAMKLGCKPECVDDLIALALAKKTDDGDFKTIIGEFKKKYPSMFSEQSDDESSAEKNKTKGQRGTGGNVSPKVKEKDDDKKSLGSRLAANRRNSSGSKKNSFWN